MSNKTNMLTVTSEVFKNMKSNYFSMRATVSVEDKSSKEEAKDEMQKLVGKTNKVLDSFKDDLKNVTTSYYSYSRRVKKKDSFYMQYYIAFESENVDKAKEIYDALAELEGVNVNPPSFTIKNVGAVEKELLTLAAKKAKEQAQMECEVLGVEFSDLEIIGWSNQFYHRDDVEVSSNRGMIVASAAMMSPARQTQEDNLKLDPGEKKVSLTLRVSYGK